MKYNLSVAPTTTKVMWNRNDEVHVIAGSLISLTPSCRYHLTPDVQASSDSSSVRKKIENDQRKAEGKGVSSNSASTMNAIHKEIEEDDNRFIAGQGRQQEQKIADQDKKLSVLGQGVDNLGVHAKIIKTELEEQNVILGELETDMDNAGDKMNVVMASLSKLLKTKDGCQLWTIVILAVVLIILVALIIWV
jgi:hypothetical protein